jgi:Transposase, Mutator family
MVSEIHANGSRGRTQHTMALDQSALLEVLDALKAAEVDDRIRQAAETIYQALIEAELASVIGAIPHQRTDTRTAHRNGHRQRVLASTAGDLKLRIPKLRSGSFFPSLLERRRRVDQSLFAVIMEAYLHGTSTRKVDDLVKALGADSGISRSEVSRICGSRHRGGCLPGPAAVRAAVPLRVPGRDLLQGKDRPPGRLPGRRRGDWRRCRWAPGGARV